MRQLGSKSFVAAKCDEGERHTWDIWRKGQVVESGIATRHAARERARVLNNAERRQALVDAEAARVAAQ